MFQPGEIVRIYAPTAGKLKYHLCVCNPDGAGLFRYTVWYNFIRKHKTLKATPAMASGLTDQAWTWEKVVELIDAANPVPKKRGPYKKKVA